MSWPLLLPHFALVLYFIEKSGKTHCKVLLLTMSFFLFNLIILKLSALLTQGENCHFFLERKDFMHLCLIWNHKMTFRVKIAESRGIVLSKWILFFPPLLMKAIHYTSLYQFAQGWTGNTIFLVLVRSFRKILATIKDLSKCGLQLGTSIET